jgi:hypothetical protein
MIGKCHFITTLIQVCYACQVNNLSLERRENVTIAITKGDSAMKNLRQKRIDAAWAIIQQAAASGLATMVPTPLAETGKHIALAGNEILLCLRIYKIYYEEEISREELLGLLQEAGIVAIVGTGLAYIATKSGQILISELSNFIWPIGAVVTAPLAGSLTAMIGISCMLFLDQAYQSGKRFKVA